jgi:hypothetical protein
MDIRLSELPAIEGEIDEAYLAGALARAGRGAYLAAKRFRDLRRD